jgi:hypothetical protein
MGKSEAWEELGDRGSDPQLNERIRNFDLEARLAKVKADALSIIDLRDCAVKDPRNREYDTRAERLMTLRLIQGVGYPINSDYGKMDDSQLKDYLSELVVEIRSGRR